MIHRTRYLPERSLFIEPAVVNLHFLSSEKWNRGSIFSFYCRFSPSFTLLQLYSHVASPLPSSPFLKFSPSASPNNILSFLPFLSLDRFSSLYPVPLFSPPPLSQPFSTLQPPYIFFSCVSPPLCSLHLSPVLAQWQREAVGRPSELH